MNTNVQINITYPVLDVARLMFSMFVNIADFDKNITAQDVRRFQAVLRDNTWADEEFRDILRMLQENYSTFWASYEDGVLLGDTNTIAASIDHIRRGIDAESASRLRLSLLRFLDKLDGNTYGVRLMQGDQRARIQARKELLAILDNTGEKSAKPASVILDMAIAPPKVDLPPVPEAPAIAALWPAIAISPGQASVWSGGKTKVSCVSVVWETHDTKTYSFVADPRILFHYKPGQFITIEVPVGGSVLRRSYTISSPPSRPYTLSITVKKVPMGWMSNWLFDNMVVGFECTVTGPVGKFTCHDHPASKLLFLAAGSGITPSMSMLRWLADTCSDADIVFINNVRTPDDIIFHQELLHMSTRFSGKMRLAIVPSAISPSRPWHGPVGRITQNLIQTYAPDFVERETFVCGPPGYMAAAKSMLAAMGLPMSQYHDESFGGTSSTPAPAAVPNSASPAPSLQTVRTTSELLPGKPVPAVPHAPVARADPAPLPLKSMPLVNVAPVLGPSATSPQASSAPQPSRSGSPARVAPSPAFAMSPVTSEVVKTARVSIQSSNDRFVVQPGQTILDAADAAGASLTHSCRAGVCGACKMHKVSGRVEMSDQNALSSADIDAGSILTCVGRPVGDVVLA